MELIFFILLFLPAVIPVVATKFLDEGLQNSQLIDWGKIYAALILLFLACICFIVEIAMGLLLGLVFVFLITCIVAFLCGLYLSYFLPRWRKLNGLLVGLVFPVILFISSTTIGLYFDPDSIIKRNGDTIAGALNKYHSDQGRYPDNLDELVPAYLADLQDPGTMWGWLYMADQDSFTLGYVYDIDSLGYSICKYSSAIPGWDCIYDLSTGFRSTEPFYLEPTPFPDPLTP